jgi:hypothetical protein
MKFSKLFTSLVLVFVINSCFPIWAFSQVYRGREYRTFNVRNSDDDKRLAELIRRLTDRSDKNLTQTESALGGYEIDIDGKFQSVFLGKQSYDGEPASACISSLAEANSFLGRNLETGQPLGQNPLAPESIETVARRHGMSVEEFRLYSSMAAQYSRLALASSASSANIVIINNDGANEGFNDQAAAFSVGEGGNNGTTRGEQRLNVFNYAASIWASFIDSPITINVRAQFDPLTPCSTSGGVLGSAGTTSIYRDFPGATLSNTWYSAALANKLAGRDLNTSNPEISATFNSSVDSGCLGSGTRFYYGLDNATPSRQINLLVVLLHEIGHGLGFLSFVNASSGSQINGFTDVFTRRMFDRSLGKYWNEMTDAERAQSALNTGNVLFDGPNVRIASSFLTSGRESSTGRVELFTPNPLQSGSSLSHFSNSASPNLLMEPAINPGLPIDLDLTRQAMRDIGWFRDTTLDGLPDTISGVSPSGETIVAGSTRTIRWTNNGGFNRNVTIELSTDGGSTFSIIAADIVNNGSFNWTVPNITTSNAKLRVREAGFAEPSALSSSSFAISPASGNSSAVISGRVVGPGNRSVPRAFIKATDSSGRSFLTQSNTFGYFELGPLPAGKSYTITASAPGLRFSPTIVNLASDLSGLIIRAN